MDIFLFTFSIAFLMATVDLFSILWKADLYANWLTLVHWNEGLF